MTDAELEALVLGIYADPFGVLGPHRVENQEPERWVVRALIPEADSIDLIGSAGDAQPMTNRLRPGFFEIELSGEPGHYRLRFRQPDGREAEIEDPYRFPPLITAFDLYLHGEGNLREAWRMLGAHPVEVDGVPGYRFAVWAPVAQVVSVVGDFNGWNPARHAMRLRDGGVWEIFLPGVSEGAAYKYAVLPRRARHPQFKADPYAFRTEVPPLSASVTWRPGPYEWRDQPWMTARANYSWQKSAISIYEVHAESWMRDAAGKYLSWRQLAERLVAYVKSEGFTHIELLPIMEYPYGGSWGYQVTGFYAPTARFGPPDDFRYFVDACHEAGIGVLVDWVPGHFPKDAFGLARFDGTALYEHEDPRKGEHRDWGTLVFNYGRNEVRNFLVSNALFWLQEYHIDGLRVDAVASMLYLDYSRQPGDWIPNQFGGRENLEAISFLKRFNELAHEVPGAITIAEESTSFPAVSRPVYLNGLGFTMKWNMGWMHDMLHYFSQDPVHRKYSQNDITFSLLYAFSENFVLPISHDEVVHGKGSLIGKMPGDEWQRFANARAFLGYMFTHPGKKLLFMGCEVGQYDEWNYAGSLRWDLLQYKFHHGLQALVKALNWFYRAEAALHEVEFSWQGFEWVDFRDVQNSVISFLRRAENPQDFLLVVCNFTPVVRENYEVGVPEAGTYREILNTDAQAFGGSGVLNEGSLAALEENRHGRPFHLKITMPPLAVSIWRRLN